METITAEALAERRFALWLCESFALLAMGLAAIGVYGLLTYVVEQRRRAIGIRLALGASRAGVVSAVPSNRPALARPGHISGLAPRRHRLYCRTRARAARRPCNLQPPLRRYGRRSTHARCGPFANLVNRSDRRPRSRLDRQPHRAHVRPSRTIM